MRGVPRLGVRTLLSTAAAASAEAIARDDCGVRIGEAAAGVPGLLLVLWVRAVAAAAAVPPEARPPPPTRSKVAAAAAPAAAAPPTASASSSSPSSSGVTCMARACALSASLSQFMHPSTISRKPKDAATPMVNPIQMPSTG